MAIKLINNSNIYGTLTVSGTATINNGGSVAAYFNGTGSSYTQGAIAIQSSNADTPEARGQGVFMFNQGKDSTWYMGTRYNNADEWQIGRVAGTSFDTAAATTGNAFVKISNSGDTTFEEDVTVNGNFTRTNRFSVTGDVSVLGATDLTIPQTRKILFDGVGGHTYMSETSDSNLKLYVAATEVVNFTNDFADFQKYIDIPNLKINSSQGTSGQVLQSTGSGIQWATLSSGGITGSGTSGKVAKFTSGTSIGDGDITFGTNTITLGDPTSSSTATLFVDTQNRRVGYRTINPTSAFEVVGTINTEGFNANEQQFFVDQDNPYIKAGAYGGGEFFGMTGSENQPKYTYSAGSGGKFVEDQRIITVKIQQNGFYNWFDDGCVLIPAQGTNTFIIVDEVIVYKSAGTNPPYGSGTGKLGQVYFGFCQPASPTYDCQMFGNNKAFDFWGTINLQVLMRSGTWVWQSTRPMNINATEISDVATRLNRAFVIRQGSDGQATSGTFNGPWYIQIKYRNIRVNAGFINNADVVITSTGSGQNSRTGFASSSVQVFSAICPGTANTPPSISETYYFDNTSTCNGNNGYPASGDKVYTTATGTTVLSAGYYYLYSGGGNRYYIQIGSSGIVSGTSCTDSINECSQPTP